MHIYSLHIYSTHEHLHSTNTHVSSFYIQHVHVLHLHTKHIHTRHCCPCSLPPWGSQASWAASWIGGREASLGTGECSAGYWSLMSAQAMNRPGNSFRELVHLLGAREGVFMPLTRWPGSLGQGMCGHVPLAREGVLEGVLSTYPGAVGWGIEGIL